MTYSAVKDSKIEWMGTIPEHWEVKKLKLLGEAITGLTYSPNDIVNENEGILVLRASNIQNGQITFDDNVYINMQIPSKLITRENDILICSRNGSRRLIGKSALIDEQSSELSFGAFTTVFRSSLSEYLFYVFQSPLFEFQIGTFLTSTINQLTIGNLNSLQIPVPSQREQKAIVNYLRVKTKEIDSLLNQKQLLISLLEQQRQSIITEAVTKGLNSNVKMKDSGVEWIGEIPEHWEVKKVKHFATHVGSGKTPSGGSEVYLDEGVPFLRSLNVHFDGIRLKDLAFISEETNAEMKSSQVKPLDILLNITGASIGRTALFPKDFGRANVNQHVCIIRLNQNKVYPYYFNIVMSSDVINQQIWFAQNGSSREGLNFVQVKELTFAIPPTLEEQREINEWIFNKQKGIFEIIASVKKQIEKLKEYRQSLIYEAVTGKIDVRDMELD